MECIRNAAVHPLVLAAVLTLANTVKPVLIDDTAYLAFARHLAAHPLEPYDFELFWYNHPQPAMEIVLPPVLPYWLALGLSIFGEHLPVLKLWLFPFASVFAFAVRSLARRFTPQRTVAASLLLTVGPGALPFFNFMLDLPALALQLATIALALRGMESTKRGWSVVLTGLTLALALQTKYSAIGLPALILLAGYLSRAKRFAIGAVLTGLLLFASWEAAVIAWHGQSHFWYHTVGYAKATSIPNKLVLALALFGHLGLTAGWAGLAFVHARFTIVLLAGFLGVIAWVPFPGSNPAAGAVFISLGALAMIPAGYQAIRSPSSGQGFEKQFLAGWLALETLVYLAVAPFPAGRRIIGVSVVVVILLLRTRAVPRSAMLYGLVSGGAILLLDVWDASAEKTIPDLAAAYVHEHGSAGTVYFVGHWGFQYYAERHGMKLVDPGRTDFHPGDWLLVPVGERPHAGGYRVQPDLRTMEKVETFSAGHSIGLGTIPNLYAGRVPVATQIPPRVTCELYRIQVRSKPAIRRP